MDGPIICFGEILIRLSAPDRELLLQSPRLNVCFGGAEANVAVSLSLLGTASRMVSIVPDNGLGRAAVEALRRYGVDVAGVQTAPGRMGLCFLTPGAMLRPSEVIYDRVGSAFAEADPNAIDWRERLKGAAVLHVSGVTPAVGANGAAAVLLAVKTACEAGVAVSFDGNYRAKLWGERSADAPAILRAILECASVAFVNDRDIALVLGRKDASEGTAERQREAAAAAFAAFPNLGRIAAIDRVQHTVDRHELSAVMFLRNGAEFRTSAWALIDIVDRIGAGDAFAAGLLHGLRVGMSDQQALDFAHAAAFLKHATPGDFNLAAEVDVQAILSAGSLDVRR